MRGSTTSNRSSELVSKIITWIYLGALIFIFGGSLLLFALLMLLGPAIPGLHALFATTAISMLSSNSRMLVGNCILVSLSGAFLGILVGLLRTRKLVHHELARTLTESLFNKNLFLQCPYVLGFITFHVIVGVAVGSIAGASGVNGVFNLTGLFGASSQAVLTSDIFGLQPFADEIIRGIGGFRGEGRITWIPVLVLFVVVQAILMGLLTGALLGTIQGVVLGMIKGTSFCFMKALCSLPITETYGEYVVKNTKEKSALYLLKLSCVKGAGSGALCGAVIGFIHGVVTGIGLCPFY